MAHVSRRIPRPCECPLCRHRSAIFAIVGEHVYGGTDRQRFYVCEACDVAFLFPRPTVQEERRFYAAEFERFMVNRAATDSGWQAPEAHVAANQHHVQRRLKALQIGIRKPGRVLEIGCSSGFMLMALQQRGFRVVGVEPSGVFSSYVKSQRIPVYAKLADVPSGKGAGGFDLIVHFFVFEHIRDPKAFLRVCFQLLKKEGEIFFEVPSRSDPLISIYNIPAFQRFYWSVAHHWYFNRRSLEYLCQAAGCRYELVSEQRYDLSNHLWWAIHGTPGGTGKYSAQFTTELQEAYLESMRRTGYCDTYFVKLWKK